MISLLLGHIFSLLLTNLNNSSEVLQIFKALSFSLFWQLANCRQVAVVLSSEWKLYVILLDGMLDGSG